MTSSAASTSASSWAQLAVASSLAQPTITAIQQQITAMLPSSVASVITAQFAGGASSTTTGSAPVQPSTIGAMPAMAFSLPGSGSSASGSTVASQAQTTITAIQQQITALLPSDLASAITSQFAGASSATGQPMLPASAASAALILPPSDLINTVLSLPQTT